MMQRHKKHQSPPEIKQKKLKKNSKIVFLLFTFKKSSAIEHTSYAKATNI